ncbi:hypothetical protein K488DRAFT_80143 [Vararia minispora EC-137]|uniref:Uncharacterized protein n=1 Tax=Vararia minispora EC-137 TaxID=1314806 RepID=A0ACB8QDV4_9AGAM|nr:hypothetical protein K488DRAFT_80143 [Vararia minispora EC-137]
MPSTPSAAQEKEKARACLRLTSRLQGNTAFKAGDFAAAVGHYSAAILADRKDYTLPLNRAAAYLKLSKRAFPHFFHARDPKFFAGTRTRSAIAHALPMTDRDADADLHDALRVEPNNDAVKTELARVATLLEKGKARAEPRKPVEVSSPPTSVDRPKRRRVPIKIVQSEQAVSTHLPEAPVSDDALLKPVSTRPLSSVPSPAPSSSASKPQTFQEAKQVRTSKAGGGIFRPSGSHTVFNPAPPNGATSSTKAPAPASARPPPLSAVPLSAPASGDANTKLQWTLFSFSRNWNALLSPADRWQLLSRIPPSALPSLFQTSLETPLLLSVLDTFHTLLTSSAYETERHDLRNWIRQYLVHFPQVPRFGTVVLFLSSNEKALTKEVLREAGADEALLAAWR